MEIVSCPTCGRTEVDLEAIVQEVEKKAQLLSEKRDFSIKIAVMGCARKRPR